MCSIECTPRTCCPGPVRLFAGLFEAPYRRPERHRVSYRARATVGGPYGRTGMDSASFSKVELIFLGWL